MSFNSLVDPFVLFRPSLLVQHLRQHGLRWLLSDVSSVQQRSLDWIWMGCPGQCWQFKIRTPSPQQAQGKSSPKEKLDSVIHWWIFNSLYIVTLPLMGCHGFATGLYAYVSTVYSEHSAPNLFSLKCHPSRLPKHASGFLHIRLTGFFLRPIG